MKQLIPCVGPFGPLSPEVVAPSSRRGGVACLLVAGLLASACGGSETAEAPKEEPPRIDDGLVIEGITGGVLCAPGTIAITNRAATPNDVRLDGIGDRFTDLTAKTVAPGETWTVAFRGVLGELKGAPDDPKAGRTFQLVSSTASIQQVQLRLRGAALDGPSSVTVSAQALETQSYRDALAFRNTTEHSLPTFSLVSGDLLSTGSSLRVEPGGQVVPFLRRSGPAVPGATLHARVEIVAGECEPVSKLVDVTVTP